MTAQTVSGHAPTDHTPHDADDPRWKQAGRAAWGLGKRIGGKPAEAVAAELQARTAEQLF